jgi:hypothetical protein
LQRDRRARWEQQRDNGIRLQAAGVAVYFGSADGSAKDLLGQVRKLVAAGYPREAMLDALTRDAAHWIGLDGEMGRLKPGSGAHVTLWSADPFDEKAKVRFSIVDGVLKQWEVKEEKAPDAEPNMAGTWELTFDQADQSGQLELSMGEAGNLSGMARVNFAEAQHDFPVSGQLSGKDFALKGELQAGELKVPVEFTGTLKGDQFTGSAVAIHPGSVLKLTIQGERKPQGKQS